MKRVGGVCGVCDEICRRGKSDLCVMKMCGVCDDLPTRQERPATQKTTPQLINLIPNITKNLSGFIQQHFPLTLRNPCDSYYYKKICWFSYCTVPSVTNLIPTIEKKSVSINTQHSVIHVTDANYRHTKFQKN